MSPNNSIQKKRVATLYVMGFFLIFGYAFAKPCIESLFLEHYHSELLPFAWLSTALISVIVVAIYNRVNQKSSILKLYGSISLICTAILLVLLAAYFSGFIPAIVGLYIFRELYMVVLMETYWSYADIVFSISTARFTYGIAMAICSAGGILGNLLVGPVAKSIGSKYTIALLLFFLLLGYFISGFAKNIADEKPKPAKKGHDVGVGIKTLFSSKYLVPLALLVCTVQVVVGLIDFEFNSRLQTFYTDTDMRTEIFGQTYALVNTISVAIQVIMGPLLRIVGIGNTFLAVPFILAATILSFVLVPHFAIILAVKVAAKSLDYSLLRGVKEILYIPLSREEKTQGKGIIDIFMYRLARGLSSLCVLGLIALGVAGYVMHVSLGLTIFWLILAFIIIKRYQKLVHNPEDS